MEIEEELAELRAELDRRNEDPKVKSFINSSKYRSLLKEETLKICEICGKEYRITHLCETVWNFVWTDLWKHYTAYEASSKTYDTQSVKEKKIEPEKKTDDLNLLPPAPSPVKNKTGGCGACFCIIFIVILIIIFF